MTDEKKSISKRMKTKREIGWVVAIYAFEKKEKALDKLRERFKADIKFYHQLNEIEEKLADEGKEK